MNTKQLAFTILASSILLTACATRLESISPDYVDISGAWLLNPELSQEVILARAKSKARQADGQRPTQDGRGQRGGGNKEGRQGRRGEQQSESAERGKRPAKPESMTSKEMTIEQNSDSMGIQYIDGSYRDVDWGKNKYRSQTVTAGWHDQKLVVKTESARLGFSETYQLDPDKNILYITYDVAGKSFVRVYERKGGGEQ